MTRYDVRAVRWEYGWELHIDGVGVTQSRGLGDAERMVRDYLHLDFGEAVADGAEIVITPEIGDGIDDEVRQARADVAEADAAQRRAAARSRAVARRMRQQGISGRDIATVLGVSPQRVSQLTREAG